MYTRHAAGLLLVAGLVACGPNGIDLGGGSSNDWLFPLTVATDVAVVDIDGDGRNDVLTLEKLSTSTTTRHGRLLVYRQTVPGVFAAPDVHLVGDYPWHFVIADIDGDRAPDVVITDPDAHEAWMLLQDAGSRGQFKPPILLSANVRSYDAAVGDLNDDGTLDIALPGIGQAEAAALILYQDPANRGEFLPPVTLAMPGGGSHLVAGDLNQDGLSDLAGPVLTAGGGANPPTIALGYWPQLPNGELGPMKSLASQTGLNVTRMVVDDYDGDGANDLMAYLTPYSSQYTATLTVVRQAAIPGTFLGKADTPVGDLRGIDDAVFADLNRDGRPDAAVGGFFPVGSPSTVQSRINLFTQSGGGTFAPTTVHDMPVGVSRVAAGDLNGDGAIDLIGFAGEDGCEVMLQSPTATGTFSAPRPLR
jgi:hypothetical protein